MFVVAKLSKKCVIIQKNANLFVVFNLFYTFGEIISIKLLLESIIIHSCVFVLIPVFILIYIHADFMFLIIFLFLL